MLNNVEYIWSNVLSKLWEVQSITPVSHMRKLFKKYVLKLHRFCYGQ